MKTIKSLLTIALTFVLSFFMMNTVSAETNTGSIVVNGTTATKTYEIYKIFDLTYSGSNVAYTIDTDWEAFFTGAGASYIVDTNSGDLNPITIGNTTRYMNITNDNIEEFTQKALTYVASLPEDKIDASKVATGETVTFDNLALGYYLVYPQGATEILPGNGTICSITSTVPDATVNIKATYPTIEKEVNEHSFNVGEYATFTITGTVPDTTGFTTYTYQINDTWTAGLQLVEEQVNFTVTIGGKTITNVTPVYNQAKNGFTLTFDMTDYQSGDYSVGDEIVVTYRLQVTEDAIDSTTTQNSATLTYSNNPKDSESKTTTPEEIEKVYSSKILVTKVDGEDNTITLAGAKFALKNSEGKYYYLHLGLDENFGWSLLEVIWKDTLEEATVFTTNEDGVLTYADIIIGFEGLKDGDYQLIETEAPQGYNKLTGPIDVTIDGTTDDNDNPIPVSQELTVENNTGVELPSTGGLGTTLFITIGALLAVMAAVVLVTNKRMAKEY